MTVLELPTERDWLEATDRWPRADERANYAFSGSRRILRDSFEQTIEPMLLRLHEAERDMSPPLSLTTGAQYGVDAVVGRALVRMFPTVPQTVVVPAAEHDAATVAFLAELGVRIERMPELPRERGWRREAYLARDARMVMSIDPRLTGIPGILMAFPMRAEEENPRSGTWTTVRMATDREIPVVGRILTTGEEFTR